MPKFSNRLKELRNSRDLSQQQLADYLHTSKSSVNMYERGEREPGLERLEAIADFFNVDMDYLIGITDIPNRVLSPETQLESYGLLPIKLQKIPMLGEIACGEPKYCEEEFQTFYTASANINADFCLIAKGDSMINARIYDGDVVFIKQQPTVDNGTIAAVIIENEATLKRVYYYPDKNKLVLNAENPAYEPFVFINEELNQIKILGKAVAFQSIVK